MTAHYLHRAIDLARRGPLADPNPQVGCVLFRGDQVIGEGWHEGAGSPHAEVAALRRHADGFTPRDLAGAGVAPTIGIDEIHAAQQAAARVAVTDDVLAYVVDLARATRQSPSVKLGVSPRASAALLATAKAWAWLGGYPAITPDHVQTMIVPTWQHRIQLRPEAEIEGVSAEAVLT